ncbi:hypothetical protein EVC17_039 [Rhizobium phage RHph_Y1_1]|nr:hypothetical protein EVB80_039 [Rhizobium phage RHph_I36]QIG75396.1 hypothetical protein EVC17_039 [Rhizobium phage RHph_Y1_1]QIG75946.1 hypothetical protein EVC21_039 [Rhizobium phage RHph_Y2_17_2]
MKEFPITDAADQQFGVVLNDRRVTVRVRYNPTTDRWSFDLSIDDVPVLYGRRIVTGVDLLRAYNFGIGLIFAAAVTSGAVPDRSSLPAGLVRIFYASTEEYEAALATVS